MSTLPPANGGAGSPPGGITVRLAALGDGLGDRFGGGVHVLLPTVCVCEAYGGSLDCWFGGTQFGGCLVVSGGIACLVGSVLDGMGATSP